MQLGLQMSCAQRVCWGRVCAAQFLGPVMLREQSWPSSADGTRPGCVLVLQGAPQAGMGPFCLFLASSDNARASLLDRDPAVYGGREDARESMEEICTARMGMEKRDREKLLTHLDQEL